MIRQNSYLSSASFSHSGDADRKSAENRKAAVSARHANRNHLRRAIVMDGKVKFAVLAAIFIGIAVCIESRQRVDRMRLGRQIAELEERERVLKIERDQERDNWAVMVSQGRFDQAMLRHGISMLPTRSEQRVVLSADTAHPQRYRPDEWAVASAQ